MFLSFTDGSSIQVGTGVNIPDKSIRAVNLELRGETSRCGKFSTTDSIPIESICADKVYCYGNVPDVPDETYYYEVLREIYYYEVLRSKKDPNGRVLIRVSSFEEVKGSVVWKKTIHDLIVENKKVVSYNILMPS